MNRAKGTASLVCLCLRRMSLGDVGEAAVSLLVNTVALTVIISIALLLPVSTLQDLTPITEANYDYRLQIMEGDVFQELDDQGVFERSFKIGVGGGTSLEAGEKTVACDVQVCDSFENLDLSYFCTASLLRKLPNAQIDDHSIAVTLKTAHELGVDLGDEVLLNGELPFTVGWVFESVSEPGVANTSFALVRTSDYLAETIEVDFSLLNRVFVTVTDEEAFFALRSADLEGANAWAGRCSSHADDVAALEKNQFSLLFVVAVSVAALCALALFVIRNAGNITAERMHDYAVLKRLGCDVRTLGGIIACDRLLYLVVPFALAVVVSKTLVFTLLSSLVFSWRMMLRFSAVCLAFMLLDIALACVINAVRVTRNSTY